MAIILLFGAPGSGKGTQASKLCNELPCVQISPGEVMRNMIVQEPNSDLTNSIKASFSRGALVAPEIVNTIIGNNITINAKNGVHSILDGYPRNKTQNGYLRKEIDGVIDNVKLVLYLKITREKLLERIMNRISCKDCGTIYSRTAWQDSNSFVCTKCGSSDFSVRTDDTDANTITKRFDVFEQETVQVIDSYKMFEQFHILDADTDPVSLSRNILYLASQAIT